MTKLTYKDAGVDIDRADQLIDSIKTIAKSTHRPGVLGGIGGFGGLFEVPEGYEKPVLVSGADGVGTKLKLAIDHHRHEGIGIDLVAMCVNDIVTCGAEPLFFLDYYASAALDVDQAKAIVESIGEGCRQAGCALSGGETAEMPGLYAEGDYDLAGFAVGVVEKAKILDGSAVQAGDVLIGLASSGPHANGFSLIRKVLEIEAGDIDALMAPTKIYVKSLQALQKKIDVHAMAHITGGGIVENLPRVLPEGMRAEVNYNSWDVPAVFKWIQSAGNIETAEMRRTFNMGVGMVVVVAAADTEAALASLNDAGETAWVMGAVCKR